MKTPFDTTPLANPALKGGDKGGFSIPPLGTTEAYSPGGLHLRRLIKQAYLPPPLMEHIRRHVDALECVVPDDAWDLSKYREILFIK